MLCKNETSLKVIQMVMGHKDIQTTMDIYVGCIDDKKKEVILLFMAYSNLTIRYRK